MSVKPNGNPCVIAEQIIEDPATGLSLQFEVRKGYHLGKLVDETVLTIFGDALPFGNREIVFSPDGAKTATGTSTRGLCKPSWLTRIDD